VDIDLSNFYTYSKCKIKLPICEYHENAKFFSIFFSCLNTCITIILEQRKTERSLHWKVLNTDKNIARQTDGLQIISITLLAHFQNSAMFGSPSGITGNYLCIVTSPRRKKPEKKIIRCRRYTFFSRISWE
jgi:hypothetical protein